MDNNQNKELDINTKQKLINDLTRMIALNSDNKEYINIMQKTYLEKNLNMATVGLIFKKDKTITSLPEVEKGIWCIKLFEVTKDNSINPRNYYSESEIHVMEDYKNKDQLNEKIDEIVLYDVKKKVVKGRTFYYCNFVSYYDFYKFSKNNLVKYNFETQRDAILTKIGETIIQQENVNLKSVEEIANLVEQDEMPPSMITFNVIKSNNNKEFVKYDEINRTLRIKPSYEKQYFVNNIDGYHRCLGIEKAVYRAINNNKTLEGGMMLLISNYAVDEAQNYIAIQNKQNAIESEHVKSFTKDNYNEFIKELNFEGSSNKNMMYDRICNTMDELKVYDDKYTTMGILSAAFELTGLKFDIPFDNEDIYMPHFIGVFNTILGYYFRQYNNDINKIKSETILLEPNAFAGYVAIGKILLEKGNNIDILKKNPKTYKKIYDYFVKMVK